MIESCTLPNKLIPYVTLDKIAPMIRIAAHPIRLRIIDFLRLNEEPQSVGAIVDACQHPQAIVSQQLRLLKDQGILACKREGNQMLYWIKNVRILFLLECINSHA